MSTPHLRHLVVLSGLMFALLVVGGCGDDGGGSPMLSGNNSAGNNASNNNNGENNADPMDAGENNGELDAGGDADVAPDVVEEVSPPVCQDVDPASPGLCRTPQQEGIGADGQALVASPPVGEVRLGRVLDETGGHGGVEATCKRGDFVLVNSVARFCVDGEVSASRLVFDGGRLVDAEPVGVAPTPGFAGRDRLDIMSSMITLQVGSAQRIEVVRDGSDGQLAVLRVSGPLQPSAYLAGIVGPFFFQDFKLQIVTEYRLRPDSAALELVTFVENRSGRLQGPSPGDIVFWGDTITSFYPGTGSQAPSDARAALGFGRGVAYGVFYEGRTTATSIPELTLPASTLTLPTTPLPDGAETAFRRWFVVAPDVAGVFDAVSSELPEHPLAGQEYVGGRVQVTRAGVPVAGALVRVIPAGGRPGDFWMSDVSDEAGEVRLRVPPGEVRFEATDEAGLTGVLETTLAGPEMNIALRVPQSGIVQLDVSALIDGVTSPSPARVVFERDGEEARRVMVLRGGHVVLLPPGLWRWEASRGMEFSASRGEIEVVEGADVQLAVTLEHVLDTPGFISGEFHQHASPSYDSDVPVEARVLSNIVEGVDFAVSSDHDVATDFRPYIEELGAQDLIGSLAGVEVSPLFGHFGAYPVQFDRTRPARGALLLSWRDAEGKVFRHDDGASLIQAMREELGAELVQMNHPRDSTGYFDSFRWDRSQPVEMAAPGFGIADTMEVINGEDCEQLQDWFSFHNQGLRVIGVGNSDTHNLSNPAGFPRNYLPGAAASPTEITDAMIIEGVKSGDLVISASAWLEFGPDAPGSAGLRPGRLIEASSVTVDVRALTPPWSEVNHLIVVRNGEIVERIEIGGGEAEIVDYDASVTLSTEGGQDAWFSVLVWGDRGASMVYRGKAVYAIANPFFLDADGDGVFTPPGARPIVGDGLPLCP